ISQAEHDELAASVLVTDSQPLLEAVEAELERQVPEAAHAERIRTALAGSQSALVLVDDLDDAITVVNAYAGEHVE
ncbi:histidinol dehydrogenase, partial [Mycobacterium tuberculosis]|nr:histidinol dehydrogenase [Mycobacterium tuberculosis]